MTKSHDTFVSQCTRCNNHIILFKYTKIICDTKWNRTVLYFKNAACNLKFVACNVYTGLTFFTSLKPLNGILRNLTGGKTSSSSTKFVFLGRSEKQDGYPGLWLAETFWTSSLKSLNEIQRNLTGSKISTSSTKFVFSGRSEKTRWPPRPLIGWEFWTSSQKPPKGIQRNLTGSRIATSYTKFVFFGPIWKKQDGHPDLWLTETFQLLLWNRWTEFDETWQEARSQHRLPSL